MGWFVLILILFFFVYIFALVRFSDSFLFMLFVRSTNPLLVIEGLKLLAVQLKDVGVCATMVRLSLFMIIALTCFLFHYMLS